ncbi:Uncharacterised protein [Vibrio cholerae]|nr:Uncharacterised protein [Vibrio cholerae]
MLSSSVCCSKIKPCNSLKVGPILAINCSASAVNLICRPAGTISFLPSFFSKFAMRLLTADWLI